VRRCPLPRQPIGDPLPPITLGYLLVLLATLVLGGAIATIGDRLGTRIGKARLSLFNLRPRKTATLVTIVTGSVISASTLGLIFLAGALELEQIQGRLGKARSDLERAQQAQRTARRELNNIDRSLQRSLSRQQQTQQRLDRSQKELARIQTQFRQARDRVAQVSRRARALQGEIQNLQSERQQLRGQLEQLDRDRQALSNQTATLSRQNQERAAQIADRENRLRAVEGRLSDANRRFANAQDQLAFLNTAVANLEQEFSELRGGNVALRRGQVLAAGLVRVNDPSAAEAALDQLLREANRVAWERLRPGTEERQAITLTRQAVQAAVQQFQDGREYFVRVLSVANYLLGEDPVLVTLEVNPNVMVFEQGSVLSSSQVQPGLSRAALRDRLELLLAQVQFRGQQAGVVTSAIQFRRAEELVDLLLWLETQRSPVLLRAVAAEAIATSGPILVAFVVERDGRLVYPPALVPPNNLAPPPGIDPRPGSAPPGSPSGDRRPRISP